MLVRPNIIRVVFPKNLAKRFKEAAKKSFKERDGCEEYAILLADTDPDGVYRIEDIYFPEDRHKFCTAENIKIPERWFKEAEKLAAVQNLEVFGDIHSHCYTAGEDEIPGTEPSEGDWDGAVTIKNNFCPFYSVFGICRIVKKKNKMRANIRFWSVPIEVAVDFR